MYRDCCTVLHITNWWDGVIIVDKILSNRWNLLMWLWWRRLWVQCIYDISIWIELLLLFSVKSITWWLKEIFQLQIELIYEMVIVAYAMYEIILWYFIIYLWYFIAFTNYWYFDINNWGNYLFELSRSISEPLCIYFSHFASLTLLLYRTVTHLSYDNTFHVHDIINLMAYCSYKLVFFEILTL